MNPRAIVIANDLVPGMGTPVAAPGLRAHGLAAGLGAHGFEVSGLLTSETLKGAPRAERIPDWIEVVDARAVKGWLGDHAPAIVVATNFNNARRLKPAPGLRIVADLFAPRLLELGQSGVKPATLEQLRKRKRQVLKRADALLINGEKKVPYYLGWLLATGRGVDEIPMHVVEMCLPRPVVDRSARGDRPLRVLIGGYVQRWSQPGPWLDEILAAVDAAGAELHLLAVPHWGAKRIDRVNPALAALRTSGRVVDHPMATWDEFTALLGSVDLVVDLFDRSLEREYAMVTRTVVAIAAGLPVIHPPFTEVSPAIAMAGAGWLVDPADTGAVGETVAAALGNPADLDARAANAVRLWEQRFDPAVALAGAIPTLRRLAADAESDLR